MKNSDGSRNGRGGVREACTWLAEFLLPVLKTPLFPEWAIRPKEI